MNYKKLYNTIIENRLKNPLGGYIERHHILPKCLGGSDDKSNLVKLSAREYYICHLLLTKIYKTGIKHSKMIYAYMMMCYVKGENQKRDYKSNSRLYESRKREFAQIMSKKIKIANKDYMWINNPTLRISKKVLKTYPIEEGWFNGRVINWDLYENNGYLIECKYCANKVYSKSKLVFCCKECRERYIFENSFLYKNKEKFKEYYKQTENMLKTFKMLGKNGIGKSFYIALKIIKEDPELLEIYNKHKYKDVVL